MTDKPDGRRWGLGTAAWLAAGLLVAYVVSVGPVGFCLGMIGVETPEAIELIHEPLALVEDAVPPTYDLLGEYGNASYNLGRRMGGHSLP